MAVPQVTSAGIGLSAGTVFLIAGVAVLGIGVAIYLSSNKNKNNVIDIETLSTNDEKYENHKWIVNNAIEQSDKEMIQRLRQNKNIMKYKDLSKLINEYLEKNQDR